MKIANVIMLTYTKNESIYEMTKKAIESLNNSERRLFFDIILMETDKTGRFQYNYENVKVIIPNEPFNYNRFLNIAMNQIKQDGNSHPYIVVANNDLIFHKGWFSEMLNAFGKYSDLMSASPFNPNNWHGIRGFRNRKNYFGYDIGNEMCGWCIVVKKEVYDIIGEHDEQFVFFCQDNDYVAKLLKHGIKHALIGRSEVTHLTSSSHNLVDNKTFRFYTHGMVERWHNKHG